MSPMPAPRQPMQRRRGGPQFSRRAVEAAIHLDRVAQSRDGIRLAEVEVHGEVVDMSRIVPNDHRPCRACGRSPR